MEKAGSTAVGVESRGEARSWLDTRDWRQRKATRRIPTLDVREVMDCELRARQSLMDSI